MPNVLGYPYDHVRMSSALTTAQYTALSTAASLKGATVSADVVTVASENVDTHQLNTQTRSVSVGTTFARIPLYTVADSTTRTEQGRGDVEVILEVYVNSDTDGTLDVIYKDPTGHRLLYVERGNNGGKLTALVDIMEAGQPAADDTGLQVGRVVMAPNGRSLVTWE